MSKKLKKTESVETPLEVTPQAPSLEDMLVRLDRAEQMVKEANTFAESRVKRHRETIDARKAELDSWTDIVQRYAAILPDIKLVPGAEDMDELDAYYQVARANREAALDAYNDACSARKADPYVRMLTAKAQAIAKEKENAQRISADLAKQAAARKAEEAEKTAKAVNSANNTLFFQLKKDGSWDKVLADAAELMDAAKIGATNAKPKGQRANPSEVHRFLLKLIGELLQDVGFTPNGKVFDEAVAELGNIVDPVRPVSASVRRVKVQADATVSAG